MRNKVIDAHFHVGYNASFDGGAGIEKCLKIMEDNQIDQAILAPAAGYATPNGVADSMAQNDYIAQMLKEYPERFPRGIAVIEPRHGRDTLDEIDRALGELGLHGLMLHNDFSGVPLDHPINYEIVERVAKYPDAVMMVHTFGHSSLESPMQLIRLAQTYPKVKFMDSHAFMTITHTNMSIEVGRMCPNVWFDTGLAHHHLYCIETAVEKIGEDRILMGSDAPYFDYCVDKLMVEKANITETARRKVLCDNAEALFGIK